MLDNSPIKNVSKPTAKSRDRILTREERKDIFAEIKDQEFRDFVFALEQTGCRPSEIAGLTADNVDLENEIWILENHKTRKKTGRPRIIFLNPEMVALTRRLMQMHPNGPLFRSRRTGRAFTPNSIRCRFRRIRDKLPKLQDVISYTFRHTFVTDALENGVGVVEVAELLGHTDTKMVMRHYQHLSEKREHLRKAAIQATRRQSGEKLQD